MKREFDEVNNPGDAWLADCKGQIRERARKKNLSIQELSAISGISAETVLRVLREDGVRHTVNTLISLETVLDIRSARIDGVKTKRQPDELPPLSSKQRRAINDWIRENVAKRKKKTKKQSA